jgi:ABC-2 type transport system ATP-binding protein
VAGIIIPSGGRIRIAGRDLREDPVGAKAQLAFIPDEPHLFEYLTVEEHLRFIGRLYGVTDVGARIPGLLTELDLSEKRSSLPGELSRGMKQKLALLLDEPLTGLDPVGIRRMKATIMRRAAAGSAVILSSHLLHLVEEICTRLLVLQQGRVVAFGTMAEIIASRPGLQTRTLEDVFLTLIGQDEARQA